ncbi:MAG: TolC family protein [Chitinophagales bacterium]
MHRLFIFILLLCAHIVQAQKTWSFEDCVNYAMENNINLSLSKLNIDYAKNTHLQNKMDLYTPNANVSITEGFNFANSINPLTYQFVQQTTNSTSLGFNADYNIFQGLQRIFQIKASKSGLNASELELKELENNTRLLVANYYLNTLLAYEAYQLALEKKKLTQNQLSNTLELVKAGVLAQGDKYEVEALLANDELNIVTSENNFETAINELKLLLQLDPFEDFAIEGLNIEDSEMDNYPVQAKMLSLNAMSNLPNLEVLRLKTEAAKYQLKAAKSSLSPTLSISAYLGSNYFSAAQEQKGSETVTQAIGVVSGTGQVVLTSYEQATFGNKSFGAQLNDNFNQSVRLNLFVPIFGKWQRMIAIDNAKLNILKTEYDLKNKENNLQQEVFTAYTNLKAAFKKYEANVSNHEAAELAFNYANEKFKAGILNSYEFETAKNRFINAEVSTVQSKYEYFFRKVIVQFYETGELNF